MCVCVCVWLKIKQSISWQVFLWSIWYFCKFLCVGAHSRITEVIPESVICICCTLHSPSLSLWLCWAWWLLWSFAPRSWAKSDHRCSWGGPVDKINKQKNKQTLQSVTQLEEWEVHKTNSCDVYALNNNIRSTQYISHATHRGWSLILWSACRRDLPHDSKS